MKIITKLSGLVLSLGVLASCDPGQPTGSSDIIVQGKAAALTTSEYNELTPEDQYRVASKLLGTIFRGIPSDEFFDLSSGDTSQPLVVQNPDFIRDTRDALRSDMGLIEKLQVDAVIDGIDEDGNPDEDAALYNFNRERPRQIPLARIKEYPISRDLFVNWMAYFLSNTILFSPATEMESSFTIDAQRVYRFLVQRIGDGESIRSIVRSNLPSLHRWRVSRSAENHALEAFELYLGLFETEIDSLRGGIACKDYYLTDDRDGYLIDVTDFPNLTPQLILEDYYVTTCDDLYDVVAGHPLLMPRVTEVIINYLMAGRDLEDRIAMIESIVDSQPETFEDIFLAVIFSREYLVETERPKSFEENLMSTLDSVKWSIDKAQDPVDRNMFINMTTESNSTLYMADMGWDVMSLKIGRLPNVPLDGLSFANYHKGMREGLLLRTNGFSGRGGDPAGLLYDDNGDVLPLIASMSKESFVDYIFLNTLQRRALDVEKTDLINLIIAEGHTRTNSETGEEEIRASHFDDAVFHIHDYISRLPELYYFQRAQSATGGAS